MTDTPTPEPTISVEFPIGSLLAAALLYAAEDDENADVVGLGDLDDDAIVTVANRLGRDGLVAAIPNFVRYCVDAIKENQTGDLGASFPDFVASIAEDVYQNGHVTIDTGDSE